MVFIVFIAYGRTKNHLKIKEKPAEEVILVLF